MTVGIFDKLFGEKPPERLLDGAALTLEGLAFQADHGTHKVWHTPAGDGLGLFAFDQAPDLPANLTKIAEFRAFYEEMLAGSGGGLVEVKLVNVGSCPALWTILKSPQEPSGMAYVASATVPFRDFSFVLKLQCNEQGVTGTREGILMDRQLASGRIELDDQGRIVGDWDPDSEEFDAEFPGHPLSRARRALSAAIGGVTFSATILAAPRFALPSQ